MEPARGGHEAVGLGSGRVRAVLLCAAAQCRSRCAFAGHLSVQPQPQPLSVTPPTAVGRPAVSGAGLHGTPIQVGCFLINATGVHLDRLLAHHNGRFPGFH